MDPATTTDVCVLAGVLFDVRALDADAGAVAQLDVAVHVDRLVVLADLVVLRHVRVEVVLPGEHRRHDAALHRATEPHRVLHRPLVEHRERPGEAEAHRTDVGVRFGAELVAAPAEQLARRAQLAVHLEADDDLPLLARGGALDDRHRVASSRTAATWNSRRSCSDGASTCTPTGKPSSPVPNGTEMAGSPTRLLGIVQTSERYIASGSSVLAPSSKAVVGD